MNNTYYVLSMDWMHSHKLQITFYMNLHIIGKSTNVLCPQSSVALRYTQLSPATAVLLMTTWNHFASKSSPLFSWPQHSLSVSTMSISCTCRVYLCISCAYHVHVTCISCTYVMCISCACHVHIVHINSYILVVDLWSIHYMPCTEGFPPCHC